jgi:drug/metabolite transporter (DMT)-like permease
MQSEKHLRACVWLLAATAVWGISFTFIKATALAQEKLIPGMSSVYFAAMLSVVRFGVSAIILALVYFRSLHRTTRLEWEQGLGLGLFGGLGIVFQMDGLAQEDLPASTSAFLTQFYCLLIPLWVALRTRALPRFVVFLSLVTVLIGVAILSNFDWHQFKMGRGEAETLISAVFFAGQILWLERPRYAGNRVSHFSIVMFASIALLSLPVGILTAPAGYGLFHAYGSREVLMLVGVIVLACTLLAYTVMNVWQPHVTATEAGLIYCVEPLYASIFALFIPGWLSRFAHIDYANEKVTWHLIVGGGLITAANVLIQIQAMRARRRAERAAK